MFIGILAFAMACGGLAAIAALIAGQSLLIALAFYSGCGLLSALVLISAVTVISARQTRKIDLLQTDAPA